MSLFASLAALIWGHFWPQLTDLPARKIAHSQRWLLDHFNAGGVQHGVLAWTLGVLAPALLLGLLAAMAAGLLGLLGWIFDVVVLYFLFGFRCVSFKATQVARALAADDFAAARSNLLAWNPALVVGDGPAELTRQTLEETLKASLITFFGVLFWYWLAGVAGAVLYTLSHACFEQWQSEVVFAKFARQVVYWLDWLPARALGFSFAIVGNFQDAAESWRDQAAAWGKLQGDDNEGVILAAGAGALGIRLGGALHLAGCEVMRPELGTGEEPEPESIDAAIALIWRAALLWLSVAGLLWLGSL